MASIATTPMKKLLNDPADIVRESLRGLAAAHGDLLRYDADAQIVVRADAPRSGKVARPIKEAVTHPDPVAADAARVAASN